MDDFLLDIMGGIAEEDRSLIGFRVPKLHLDVLSAYDIRET